MMGQLLGTQGKQKRTKVFKSNTGGQECMNLSKNTLEDAPHVKQTKSSLDIISHRYIQYLLKM